MTTGPDHRPTVLRDTALQAVLQALPEARIVGGAVRDTLAGIVVHDIDLATPRRPEAVMATLRGVGLKAVPTGLAHGTVTAVADHRGFEITTLRRDVITDGRHAVVAFTEDWREDAARRDFTINAMSMAADGTVFDYFGGREDLRDGRVRFVGDPTQRIREDYLRILRFFRFWARYGKQRPDAQTCAALQAGRAGLTRISAERIWGELSRLLAAPDPAPAIASMDELGVLAVILPEGTLPARLGSLVATGAPADPILRLAALLDGDASALAARLRLSARERNRLMALRQPPVPGPDADDNTLRRLLADIPADILIDRTWLGGSDNPAWSRLRERLANLPRPLFTLVGRDVLRLGVVPGPKVGDLLRHVRQWWLEGGCTASPEECRSKLLRLVEQSTSD